MPLTTTMATVSFPNSTMVSLPNSTSFEFYDKDVDSTGAVVYMCVVIGIFAMGIFTLICQSVRTASHDREEGKKLVYVMEQLAVKKDQVKRRTVTKKLALGALNTVNGASSKHPPRVTYV